MQLLKVNEEISILSALIWRQLIAHILSLKEYLRIKVIDEEDVYMEVGGDDVMMGVVTSHPDRDHMITSKSPLHIIAGVIR